MNFDCTHHLIITLLSIFLEIPELLSRALKSSPVCNQLNGNRQVLKPVKSAPTTPQNREFNRKRLFSSLQENCSTINSSPVKKKSCETRWQSGEDENAQTREGASQVLTLLVSTAFLKID